MENKARIGMKNIPFDYARSEHVAKSNKQVILLYDDARGCYYETTVDHIISSVLMKLREHSAVLDKKYKDFEEKMEGKQETLARELKKQQMDFIADSAATNEKLINLVEAIQK